MLQSLFRKQSAIAVEDRYYLARNGGGAAAQHTLCTLKHLLHLAQRLRELFCLREQHVSWAVGFQLLLNNIAAGVFGESNRDLMLKIPFQVHLAPRV